MRVHVISKIYGPLNKSFQLIDIRSLYIRTNIKYIQHAIFKANFALFLFCILSMVVLSFYINGLHKKLLQVTNVL